MAEVSVIIPVRNAKATLERCVESVLAQTLSDLEVILVDDGSTDGSGEVMERLALRDPRVRCIRLAGAGVSEARNAGLAAACGDYVTFVDADDWIEESFAGRLISLLEERGADFAGCGFVLEQGSSLAREGTDETLRGEEIVREAVLGGNTRVWSKVFRRSALEETRFVPGLTIGEDMLFVLSQIKPSSVYAEMRDPLYHYRVNPQGAMERPFVPSYTDQVLCWKLARFAIERRFPKLLEEEEARGRMDALLLTGAVLLASKVARAPGGPRAYPEAAWIARDEARRLLPGALARPYLPEGYWLKANLLVHASPLFYLLMGRR